MNFLFSFLFYCFPNKRNSFKSLFWLWLRSFFSCNVVVLIVDIFDKEWFIWIYFLLIPFKGYFPPANASFQLCFVSLFNSFSHHHWKDPIPARIFGKDFVSPKISAVSFYLIFPNYFTNDYPLSFKRLELIHFSSSKVTSGHGHWPPSKDPNI